MTTASTSNGLLRLSWTRIRTHSECPAKGSLIAAGHKSPITDARVFFAGNVADRCMRQWLSLDVQERGWMAAQVTRVMDQQEQAARDTGDGVVRWKHASDRAEVRELCTRAVTQLEDDLRLLLWLDNAPGAQCDWDPAIRFEVPITIPHPRGDKERILLVGEMDLLVRRPDGHGGKQIEVWDLKTTRDNSYWRKTLGQLVFYEIVEWCMTKEWPSMSGLLQPLCDETMPNWSFNMDHRTQMLQRIVSTAGDIWSGRLDPKPEKAKCGYCEVRHACPLKGLKRGRAPIGAPVTGLWTSWRPRSSWGMPSCWNGPWACWSVPHARPSTSQPGTGWASRTRCAKSPQHCGRRRRAMPGDLDAEVADLKRRIGEAGTKRARAAAAAEAQQLRAREAAETLLREFGVGPEEAAQAIAAKEADLAAEVRRVREALERAEASE